MMNRDRRIVWWTGSAPALAGGCTGADENVLGTFICDSRRSAVAANPFPSDRDDKLENPD